MSNLTTVSGALPPAPARMQQQRAAGQSIARNFTDGVRDSFPVISIKGGKWAFRFQGQTHHHVDHQRMPMPYLDVVLANANQHLSKAFYLQAYTDPGESGGGKPPDCWSVDSVRPDPSVPNKQANTCPGCPQNSFGSRLTGSGKPGKACQDSRRMAVVVATDLLQSATALMLKVPYTSLANLKEYITYLDRNGYEPNGCVTRMSFEMGESYPKIKFSFERPLTDPEYDKSVEAGVTEIVTRMLTGPITSAESEPLDDAAQQQVSSLAASNAPPAQPAYAPPAMDRWGQAPTPTPPPVTPWQQPPQSPQMAPAAPPAFASVPAPPAPAFAAPAAPTQAPPAFMAPPAPPTQVPAAAAPPPGFTLPPGAPAPTPRTRKPRAVNPPKVVGGTESSEGNGVAEPDGVKQAPPGLESVLAHMMPKN